MSVVEQLANDLQMEFPGVRGFSARNIRNMKRFYEFYAQFEIGNLATVVAKLQSNDHKRIEFTSNSATAVADSQNLYNSKILPIFAKYINKIKL